MQLANLFSRLLRSRWLLPVLVGFCFLTLPEQALAATTVDGLDKIVQGVTTFANFFVIIAIWVAMSFGLLVGSLLDSTYIFDAGMADTLYGVWAVLRNFVNVAFIVILLVFAVLVVLGIGDESGLAKLKKVLPKFIIALVLVNLTFFAGRVVLTTADVLATAVFSVPQALKDQLPEDIKIASLCAKPTYASGSTVITGYTKLETTTECRTFWNSELNNSLNSSQISAKMDKVQKILSLQAGNNDGYTARKAAELFDKKNAAFAIVSNMLAMSNSLEVKAQALDTTVKKNADVLLNLVFSIVSAAVIAFLVFALLVALIARMVVLWILLAISPLVALAMVLGELIPGVSEESLGFDIKGEFFKAAFMPVMVAAPLSIGFVMILAALNQSEGQFFQQALWWLASVLVLWFGTFKALKAGGQFVEKAAGMVEEKATSFMGGVGQTLQYMPFIPAPGNMDTNGDNVHDERDRVSIGGMTGMFGRVPEAARQADHDRMQKTYKGIDRMMGVKGLTPTEFNDRLKRATKPDEIKSTFQDGAKFGDVNAKLSQESLDKMKQAFRAAGEVKTVDAIGALSAGATAAEVARVIAAARVADEKDDRAAWESIAHEHAGLAEDTGVAPAASAAAPASGQPSPAATTLSSTNPATKFAEGTEAQVIVDAIHELGDTITKNAMIDNLNNKITEGDREKLAKSLGGTELAKLGMKFDDGSKNFGAAD